MSITATADSNSTISPSGTTIVQTRSSQTFTFSAKPGYYISSVTVDGVALSQAQINIGQYIFSNVIKNHIIDVRSLPTYTVTATADPNSTISPSGTTILQTGSSQTFTFSANPGHFISSVTVDGLPLSKAHIDLGQYTFSNVIKDHTIVVESARNYDYWINVNYREVAHWFIYSNTGTNTIGVYAGEDYRFYFEPDEDRFVFSANVNGWELTHYERNLEYYTLINISGNSTIEITYGPKGGIYGYEMERKPDVFFGISMGDFSGIDVHTFYFANNSLLDLENLEGMPTAELFDHFLNQLIPFMLSTAIGAVVPPIGAIFTVAMIWNAIYTFGLVEGLYAELKASTNGIILILDVRYAAGGIFSAISDDKIKPQ
jgi:hypothetical protein